MSGKGNVWKNLFGHQPNIEKTDYEKIMRLCDKKEFDSKNLNKILNTLYPFCFYSEEHKDNFRNKEKMRKVLEENKLLIYKKE